MILELSSDMDNKKSPNFQEGNSHANSNNTPSGSNTGPPAFRDHNYGTIGLELNETGHLAVDFPEEGDVEHAGPPPEFAPYEAEYFEVGYNDVVSHDPHLNSDGEALYRFLLSQSRIRPSQRLHCRGTHTERRNRWVTERDSSGRSRHRQESYTETIVDFDFCLDIAPELPAKYEPIHWSVADDEPAYRGNMIREYGSIPFLEIAGVKKNNATSKQIKNYKKWIKRRNDLGLPPWVRQEDPERATLDGSPLEPKDTLQSSKTLRQWADEYCASPKYLKEFVYEKVLYGWNLQQIESAVRSTIEATPYNGCLDVKFIPYGRNVYVRPDNRISRVLSNKWLKLLSIILFIFPFIWLFKRFHSRGGGRWEVCGGAYALKQWVPVESSDEAEMAAEAAGEHLPAYSATSSSLATASAPTSSEPTNDMGTSSRRWMQTSTGPKKLLGLKEGEWFRQWEGAIKRAVIGGYKSQTPLPPSVNSPPEVQLLDGYNEASSLITSGGF